MAVWNQACKCEKYSCGFNILFQIQFSGLCRFKSQNLFHKWNLTCNSPKFSYAEVSLYTVWAVMWIVTSPFQEGLESLWIINLKMSPASWRVQSVEQQNTQKLKTPNVPSHSINTVGALIICGKTTFLQYQYPANTSRYLANKHL